MKIRKKIKAFLVLGFFFLICIIVVETYIQTLNQSISALCNLDTETILSADMYLFNGFDYEQYYIKEAGDIRQLQNLLSTTNVHYLGNSRTIGNSYTISRREYLLNLYTKSGREISISITSDGYIYVGSRKYQVIDGKSFNKKILVIFRQ